MKKSTDTERGLYELTDVAIKQGLMHVPQNLERIFPKESGKIAVNLYGTGGRNLTYNAKMRRVYGLSHWYETQFAREGDRIVIQVIKRFGQYDFHIARLHFKTTKQLRETIPREGILSGGSALLPYRYPNEKEFEKFVTGNYRKFLGEGTRLVPLKMPIGFKLKKIPDGLVLDTTDPRKPSVWIVEVELSVHRLESHIQNQVMGFLRALRDENSLRKLTKAIDSAIFGHYNEDEGWVEYSFQRAVEAGGTTSSYEFVYNLLREKCGVLIIIDELTPELDEVVGFLSKIAQPIRVIEIKAFGRGGNLVHVFSRVLAHKY